MTRWALAGFGAGGQTFHAPLVAAAPGLDLVAAITSDPARRGQARDLGLATCGGLADLPALGVDGVTITTPAGTHATLAHQALDLGLHVVVDKPFAITGADAEDVVAHARDAGLVLTAYQNRRWDGDFLTLVDLVASGRLGAVHRFTTSIERFHPTLPRWTTRAGPLDGGGTLVDLGAHLIDQAVTLLGPVTSVLADFKRIGPDLGAENDVLLLLHHERGPTTTVVASLAAATQGPRFTIQGELGGVQVDGFDVQEEQLFAGHAPDTHPDSWGREPAGRTAALVVGDDVIRVPLARGQWDAFYPAVEAAIRGVGEVPVDPDEAIHVCRIFDAARRSAGTGRTIRVAQGDAW